MASAVVPALGQCYNGRRNSLPGLHFLFQHLEILLLIAMSSHKVNSILSYSPERKCSVLHKFKKEESTSSHHIYLYKKYRL